MSIDTKHNPRSWECERNQLPMTHSPITQGGKEKIQSVNPNDEEEEENTSRKRGSNTSEDISKLPDLPEDDDYGSPNDICKKIKLTNKTKENGYITKRNRKNMRKRLIEIEYYKTKMKLKKYHISYLQKYLRWIRVQLDKINAKMSKRIVTNDANNEMTLSYGKLVIRRGETAMVNGDDQSERGVVSRDISQDTVREQTTPKKRPRTAVNRQPLYATNIVTRSQSKRAKVVMEARTENLIK